MNGLSKQTWLELFADKTVGGLLYDYFTNLEDTIMSCDDKYVSKTSVKVAGLIILAFLFGAGVLTYPTILRLISLI